MTPMLKAAPPREVFAELARCQLLVVSGKGGVGRTTIAALLGLALANRGRRVLVATTGLDDRLAWMLGAPSLESTPVEVAPRMWIQRLVPHDCIREYGTMTLHSGMISEVVLDNKIVRRLLRAIPGVDDFAVLGKVWHEGVRADNYDVVLFDGSATGHLPYVLGVPQALLRAVPKGPLTREAQQMQSALEDPQRTQAVLVGLPEPWPLTELSELAARLRQDIGMRVGAVLVNGVWPGDLPMVQPPREAGKDAAWGMLERINRMAQFGRRHREIIDAWRGSEAAVSSGASALMEVPWQFGGLQDVSEIRDLQATLEQTGSARVEPPQSES